MDDSMVQERTVTKPTEGNSPKSSNATLIFLILVIGVLAYGWQSYGRWQLLVWTAPIPITMEMAKQVDHSFLKAVFNGDDIDWEELERKLQPSPEEELEHFHEQTREQLRRIAEQQYSDPQRAKLEILKLQAVIACSTNNCAVFNAIMLSIREVAGKHFACSYLRTFRDCCIERVVLLMDHWGCDPNS